MEYLKKKRIKETLKRNKWILIGSGAFLTIGAVAFLVGMYMGGWSIMKWLKSGYAPTCFICIIGGALLLLLAFLIKRNADLIE